MSPLLNSSAQTLDVDERSLRPQKSLKSPKVVENGRLPLKDPRRSRTTMANSWLFSSNFTASPEKQHLYLSP